MLARKESFRTQRTMPWYGMARKAGINPNNRIKRNEKKYSDLNLRQGQVQYTRVLYHVIYRVRLKNKQFFKVKKPFLT